MCSFPKGRIIRMSFFEELKRRNVFRVGIAYVVIGWVLAQVAKIPIKVDLCQNVSFLLLYLSFIILKNTVYDAK